MSRNMSEVNLIIEIIRDEWYHAMAMDLEHGVAWMNDTANAEFARNYPNIAKFGCIIDEIEDKWTEKEQNSPFKS